MNLREKSVMVFQASDWDDARQRIIALARGPEELYVNGQGERVRTTVSRIVTLDLLSGHAELGDREVHSEIEPLSEPDPTVPFDVQFPLERSQPYQTGV